MSAKRTRNCPACSKPISFRQVVAGAEGHAIVCGACGAHLMKKTRAILPAAVGGTAAWAAAHTYGWLSWEFWSTLVGLLAGVTALALATVRVRLATEADHGPLKMPPGEKFSGKPPPLDPTFRGMSGPPPKNPSVE